MHHILMTKETNQTAKCLKCDKEYIKVKSWQKYCDKECKAEANAFEYNYNKQSVSIFGYSDNMIFINDKEFNKILGYSYNSKEIVMTMPFEEYLRIRDLKKEQDIKMFLTLNGYAESTEPLTLVGVTINGGETNIILNDWFNVQLDNAEVTSERGKNILVKLTYKILSTGNRKKIKGLERMSSKEDWKILYKE